MRVEGGPPSCLGWWVGPEESRCGDLRLVGQVSPCGPLGSVPFSGQGWISCPGSLPVGEGGRRLDAACRVLRGGTLGGCMWMYVCVDVWQVGGWPGARWCGGDAWSGLVDVLGEAVSAQASSGAPVARLVCAVETCRTGTGSRIGAEGLHPVPRTLVMRRKSRSRRRHIGCGRRAVGGDGVEW